MKLQIQRIAGYAPPESQRLILEVLDETDLNGYLVIDALHTPDGFQMRKDRCVYSFPKKIVSKGDKVVLCTGQGEDSEIKINKTSRSHIFYWNLPKHLWRRHIGNVFLAHVDGWESKKL